LFSEELASGRERLSVEQMQAMYRVLLGALQR
jgi:hypothetical protein